MKRSPWIDRFIAEEMVKIAKTLEANYVERLKTLKEHVEAKKTKWSSIEDALNDFATRNGFTRKEMTMLTRAAGITAQLQPFTTPEELADEGIGSQGAEYMAKNKKKHTRDTPGPFVVQDPGIAKKVRKNDVVKHDLQTDTGNAIGDNEMKYIDKAGGLVFAQQFGKILDIGAPGEESMKKLVKELTPGDSKPMYNLIRHGFKFTNIAGNEFTRTDEPVKVTVYKYSFLKTNIANAINETLRNQLAQELPVDEWISWLAQKAGPEVRDLKNKLQQLKRDLFSDKPAFVETEKDRTKPQSINGILQHFPAAYQRQILSMLAEGEYRHLTGETGRKHSNIFASGYALGSFVLMESFDPFVKVTPKLTSKEQKQALIDALASSGKDTLNSEEFTSLLDSAGLDHDDMPTGKDSQKIKLKDKEITVQNGSNPEYRPVTNKLSDAELTDPELVEEQLKSFQDRLAAVIMRDADKIEKAKSEGRPVPELTPLAYERQQDGSYSPVTLKNIGKRDLTSKEFTHEGEGGAKTYVENPTAGLHPSYSGAPLKQVEVPGRLKVKTDPTAPRWNTKPGDVPGSSNAPEKKPTAPSAGDKWKELLKQKNLKKFEAVTHLLIRFGAADLWVDDKGKVYPSEDAMLDAMSVETLELAKPEIVEEVVDKMMQFVEQLPKNNVVQMPKPEPKQQFEESEEEEPLPLAAKSIDRLKKIAAISEKLSKLLKE